MPARIGRPPPAIAPDGERVGHERDGAEQLGQGADPRHAVIAEREPERDQWRPDGQPGQGHHGAPARHDPGARDRRRQMDQRGRDDQREEAEDVEPRVSRLQEGPPLDDRRNAGEHGDDEADPKGDLREGRTVCGHDQRSTRSAAGAQRPESRHRRAGETGQVAESTGDGQGLDPARDADARGRRPTGDQPDRATANDPVDRRSDREGGDEERQDAGDGRAGGPGKREVERQPHAPSNRFGQGCSRHSQRPKSRR